MNEPMKPFLLEGLSVYAEARATIAFFEQEICKLLQDAAELREDWPFLKSKKICQPKSEKGAGQLGYWVAMAIEGTSHRGEPIEIDCGVWWNALRNGGPIIYASFTGEPKRVLTFSWTKQEDGIKSFDRFGRTFLYISALKSTDIGGSLNQILDELLKQLK